LESPAIRRYSRRAARAREPRCRRSSLIAAHSTLVRRARVLASRPGRHPCTRALVWHGSTWRDQANDSWERRPTAMPSKASKTRGSEHTLGFRPIRKYTPLSRWRFLFERSASGPHARTVALGRQATTNPLGSQPIETGYEANKEATEEAAKKSGASREASKTQAKRATKPRKRQKKRSLPQRTLSPPFPAVMP